MPSSNSVRDLVFILYLAHFYVKLVFLNFKKVTWFSVVFLTSESSHINFSTEFRDLAGGSLRLLGSVPVYF